MTTLRALLQPVLLGVLALGMTAGARAADPVTTTVKQADAAMRLAQYLYSDEAVVGDSRSDEKAVDFARQLIEGSPEVVDLEKDHPGIVKDLARVSMPIINASARKRLPGLWQREADLYRSAFRPEEIEALITFYQSPTGKKLIRELTRNFTGETMIAEARKSEDMKMSAASALADGRATVPAVLKAMGDADDEALLGLAKTGLMPRMQAIAPQTHQILLDWYDESLPGEDEAMDKAMTRVIEARIKADSKK